MWLEIVFNQSRTVNTMKFLWVRGSQDVNISVHYKETDTAEKWINVLEHLSAPTSEDWQNISAFTPFDAKRIKMNFSDTGWVYIYEWQAITPGGVEGPCYIYMKNYSGTDLSGNHSMTSYVNTPTGNASAQSNFMVNYGIPSLFIQFPSSLINNTNETYTGASIKAMNGDLRNVSVNLSVENATLLEVTSLNPYTLDFVKSGESDPVPWKVYTKNVGISNITVRANSTTGKGGCDSSSKNISVILEDPYPPEISEFHFQYGCSVEQSPITKANLYYDACAWVTIIENLTGVKGANLSVTFPDNSTYTGVSMSQHGVSGNISWWKLSFPDSLPLNMTGEYNASIMAFDYGGNNATSNETKNINNTVNVTNIYTINFTNNHTIYNRGENPTFETLDANNFSVAQVNWTINVTINGTQNITNSTENPFVYQIGESEEGLVSIELNVSGNNNSGSLRWDFNVSKTLYPDFVSPAAGAQYTPSTVIYSEARVLNERGEVLDYSCTVNLTCPYMYLLMGGGPPENYLDTSGNCTAHSEYDRDFSLTANAWDDYNNSGTEQVSLKTSSKTGDVGRRTGGATGGVISPPPICNCTNWENVACGAGGCPDVQMYQTRRCLPENCSSEYRCIDYLACREENFDFSLAGEVTINQGEDHKIKIYVNNTGKIAILINITAESDCCYISLSEAMLHLSTGGFRDIFMTLHVTLNQSPEECPVNVNLASSVSRKTKGLKVIIAENDIMRNFREQQEKLAEIEKHILELSSSVIDISGLRGLKESAAQVMENVKADILRDDIGSFETDVTNLANLISAMEDSIPTLFVYKFMFDNMWYIMGIVVMSILITYLISQVLLPFSRLGKEVKVLTRKEKEFVQTRINTEKQYFRRQIDEKTFNTILVKKQEEILRTRGLITSKNKERSILIMTGLSPSALGHWLASGPKRLAAKIREKTKKHEPGPKAA